MRMDEGVWGCVPDVLPQNEAVGLSSETLWREPLAAHLALQKPENTTQIKGSL